LPGPEESSANDQTRTPFINQWPLLLPENDETQENQLVLGSTVEMPATPKPEEDIEDAFKEGSCEIPIIDLDMEELTLTVQNYIEQHMELQEGEISKALVALHPDAARIPAPKLKDVSKLRTEHLV